MSTVSSLRATLVGQLGLLMWAVVSALYVLIKHLPAAEILFCIFCTSAFFSLFSLTVTNGWSRIQKQSVLLWVFNILGICGSDVLFLLASQNAPQEEVVLINYLWPTMIVLLAPLLPEEKFQWKYLLSAVIALCGIVILVTDGQGLSSFDTSHMKGYIIVFTSACLWSVYAIASKRFPAQAPEAIGLYCTVGAIILALGFSDQIFSVVPKTKELLILVYMGLTSHNLAYLCWGFGMRYGNVRSLALQVYLSPFVSLATLVVIGYAEPSASLWIAAVCVCGAGLISAINWHRLLRGSS